MTCPSFNLTTTFRMRDRLIDQLIGHQCETLQGDDLLRLAAEICRVLPVRNQDAVFESVRYLAGTELTVQELARMAWRLAGNVKRLADGVATPPWSAQAEPEWVPLEILSAMRARDQYKNLGYRYTFRILAGTACPLQTFAFWKPELTRGVSGKIGFSAPWGKYPFHGGQDLVGLRLAGLLDPKRSRERPTFYDMDYPGAFVTWNRENVLQVRCRVLPCPRRYAHPCRRCAVGYDQCPAAVHSITYSQGPCEGCGTEVAYFDPAIRLDKCVACDEKERLRA